MILLVIILVKKKKFDINCQTFELNMERVMGIEPTSSAWKAEVIPLYHTRKIVGKTGFEPATSWSQTRRSTKLSYFP